MHTLEIIFGQNNELFNLKFKIMVKLNKRIFGILILCMFLSVSFAFSQKSTNVISGIVTDLKGETLIGVNVLIKGTKTGTVTDSKKWENLSPY